LEFYRPAGQTLTLEVNVVAKWEGCRQRFGAWRRSGFPYLNASRRLGSTKLPARPQRSEVGAATTKFVPTLRDEARLVPPQRESFI